MAKTIAGLYDSFQDAREVQTALVNAGFDRKDISILAANADNRYKDFVDRNIDESEYDKYYVTDDDGRNRAAEGATAGGVLGGAGGLVLALLVPGAGPFTVTGWLAASLIGLAGGAITGGILGALADAGIDDADATVYSEGVRRGYSLITVKADDNRAAQAARIMNDHGAINTDERADYWESQGWERSYDADAPVYNLEQIEAERTGYQSYNTNGSDGVSTTDDDYYRNHYTNNYANSGRDYNYYDPHYRYGYGLASNPTYAGRDWNMIESDVRRDWETRYRDNDSTWDDVKDAVRSGWYSVKNAVR